MRVAVVGGRTYTDYDTMCRVLDRLTKITTIVSGGAIGADSLGARYAVDRGIDLVVYRPDWDRYGRGAGFRRNKTIVNNSDIVYAFWDGVSKGTSNTINYAKKLGVKCVVVPYDPPTNEEGPTQIC